MEKQIQPRRCAMTVDAQVTDVDGDENHKIVHLKARSYEPIPFWGMNEIMDFPGMRHVEQIQYDRFHEDSREVGFADNIRVTEEFGLEMDGHIFLELGEDAQKLVKLLKRKARRQVSITFWPWSIEEVAAGATAEANGQQHAGPCQIVRDWSLLSVTDCPTGMDMKTETIPTKLSITQGENDMGKDPTKIPPKTPAKRSASGNPEDEKPEDEKKPEDRSTDESGGEDTPDVEVVDVEELKAKLAEQEAAIATLTEELNALKAAAATPGKTEDTPTEERSMARLTEELAAMKQKLEDVERRSLGNVPDFKPTGTPDTTPKSGMEAKIEAERRSLKNFIK